MRHITSRRRRHLIKAKPDEGWKFVKWTKDGEDFLTESEITVEVTDDVEYEAVFDVEGQNGEDYTYDPE